MSGVVLDTVFKLGKGMETAADKVFLFKEYPSQFPKEFIRPRVTGKNIERYSIEKNETYILYFENIENFEDLPNSIQNHLLENRKFLENRATVKNEGRVWWRYSRPMHKELYHHNKIFCSRRAFENTFAIDCDNKHLAFSNMTTIFDTNDSFDLKYLLALLNSKVLNFRYKSIGKQTGGGSFEFFPNGVGKLPIPNILKEEQKPFISLVDIIIDAKEKIAKYKKHYESLIAVDKIEIKEEIEKLESLVSNSVTEIDSLIYELYGLSNEEIQIVEAKK